MRNGTHPGPLVSVTDSVTWCNGFRSSNTVLKHQGPGCKLRSNVQYVKSHLDNDSCLPIISKTILAICMQNPPACCGPSCGLWLCVAAALNRGWAKNIQNTTITCGVRTPKKQFSENGYCRGRAGAGPPLVHDSYVIVRKKTELDTQPQTTTRPTTPSSP
jgi:hypothetical protein